MWVGRKVVAKAVGQGYAGDGVALGMRGREDGTLSDDKGRCLRQYRQERGLGAPTQYLTNATSPMEDLMRDIATATLSGNLTRDVELRNLPSGTDVARLRVATTTRRRSGEEWVDKTNYFTVEAFGAQARSCAQYLRKGSRVFVDAELDWRGWTDQQDHKREAVTFKARQVLFEGGRSIPAADAGEGSEQNGTPPPGAGPGDTLPVGGSAGGEGCASAEDLPF